MVIIAKKTDFFQFGLMVYKEFSLILSFLFLLICFSLLFPANSYCSLFAIVS
jgi:hypothetical protein